ncbi:MAG: diacylglycerol kinase family protein [Chloroflexota bacterium]|jgi:diacylglycerol kinase
MARPLARSFQYAYEGICHTFKTQRSFRIQLAIGLAAVGLGLWVGLTPAEWAILTVIISLVLSAEMVNTAIEALADATCPDHNPLIGIAKDVAAGAVLITALGSVVVGLFLFGPYILELLLQ